MSRGSLRALFALGVFLIGTAMAGVPGGIGEPQTRLVLRFRAEEGQFHLQRSSVVEGDFRPFRPRPGRPGMLVITLLDAGGQTLAGCHRDDPLRPCHVCVPGGDPEPVALRAPGPLLFEIRFPVLDARQVRIERLGHDGARIHLASIPLSLP